MATTLTKRLTAHPSRVAWVEASRIDPHVITITTTTTPYGLFVTADADNILLAAAIVPAKKDVTAFTHTHQDGHPDARIVTRHDDGWRDTIFAKDTPLVIRAPDTPFRQTVHTALTTIPSGTVVSYQDVAVMIGQPHATRAVASAIAANMVAVAVPCHRVWRSNGALGGFRWGADVKRRLCDDEQAAVL